MTFRDIATDNRQFFVVVVVQAGSRGVVYGEDTKSQRLEQSGANPKQGGI